MKTLAISIFIAIVTTIFASEPAPLDFQGEALKLKTYLEELFDASKKVNAEGETKKSSRLKLEQALDWERVARDCLGNSHWKQQSAANRDSFKKLLKDVILKTAFSRIDKFWNDVDKTTYLFEAIDIKNLNAHVKVKFNVKSDTILLEYYMEKKGPKWMLYDVAYEELRYSVNINEQIDAFLKEKSFTALLDKLRKRREELDEEKPAG